MTEGEGGATKRKWRPFGLRQMTSMVVRQKEGCPSELQARMRKLMAVCKTREKLNSYLNNYLIMAGNRNV